MTHKDNGSYMLSVITINYNNFSGLKRTVVSVINQSWKEFEYIVIDGGSTDGSAEYISEMKNHFAFWVSEPDTGIYNAMNKGLKAANGEYVYFLNSGDCLVNDKVIGSVLLEIQNVNKESGKQNIFLGSTKQIGNDDWFSPPDSVTLYHLYRSALPHQGLFLPRGLALRFMFKEDYRIVSDWIQSVEILLAGTSDYVNIKEQKLIAFNEAFGACASPMMQKEKDKYIAQQESVFRRIENYDMLRKKYDELNYIRNKGLLNRALWKCMSIISRK
jgi:glycosyltransferase involved in cell wall biosynthesis